MPAEVVAAGSPRAVPPAGELHVLPGRRTDGIPSDVDVDADTRLGQVRDGDCCGALGAFGMCALRRRQRCRSRSHSPYRWDSCRRRRPKSRHSLRGQCAEFGVVAAQNRTGVTQLITLVQDADDHRLPDLARTALAVLVATLETLRDRIAELDRELLQWHRHSPVSRRVGAIPGVGPLTATALTAALGDGRHFRSGRQFAASLGLVPRQFGTGGTVRLERISKRGDGYLRRNLVHGARAALSWRLRKDGPGAPHLQARVAAKSMNVVAVAVANRNARIAWAMGVGTSPINAPERWRAA